MTSFGLLMFFILVLPLFANACKHELVWGQLLTCIFKNMSKRMTWYNITGIRAIFDCSMCNFSDLSHNLNIHFLWGMMRVKWTGVYPFLFKTVFFSNFSLLFFFIISVMAEVSQGCYQTRMTVSLQLQFWHCEK